MASGRGGLRVEPGKPKTLTWKIVGERCTLWVAGWGEKPRMREGTGCGRRGILMIGTGMCLE